MHQILVAGHVCVDVVPGLPRRPDPSPGSLTEIGPLALVPGGCVANTGSMLTSLGECVRIAANVGDDELGRILRGRLADTGLDPSSLATVPDLGTSYSIVLEPASSDRSIWHYLGANATFDGADLDLADVALLHLGYPALLPALLDSGGSALIRLLGRARQWGVTTSLDLSVVAKGTRLDGYDWPAFLRRTLPFVDVLSPSADDLGSMLGTAAVGSIDQLRALASSLVGGGAGVVIITAGHDGLVVESAPQARLERAGAVLAGLAASWADASLWVPAPKVAVTSTTGAGDAASAAIIHALLQAQDPLTAARTTVGIASAKVGGTPVSGAARPANLRA